MASLEPARQLARQGLFSDALATLELGQTRALDRKTADGLRAYLWLMVGRVDEARTQARMLLVGSKRNGTDQGLCEWVLGQVLLEDGSTDAAIEHFQKSSVLASSNGDLRGDIRARLDLFSVLSERHGADTAAPLLAEIRPLVVKSGDVHDFATLHLRVAEAEGKRGSIDSAVPHVDAARRLLLSAPNAYLEAFVANFELAISVLRSEFAEAERHGHRAIALAEQAGAAMIWRAAIGNMGNLYYALGDPERAIEYFDRALTATPLPRKGIKYNAALETIARIRLLQGRLEDCATLLDTIEASLGSDDDRMFYGHRCAELTRAELLARQGRLKDALRATESVLTLADRAGDMLLRDRATLTKAAVLERVGKRAQALTEIRSVIPAIGGHAPELFAQAEHIVARILFAGGDVDSSRCHVARAKRIQTAIRVLGTSDDLSESETHAEDNGASSNKVVDRLKARTALQSIVTAVIHGTHPEIVASELLKALSEADCIYGGRIAVSEKLERLDGKQRLLHTAPTGEEVFHIGAHHQRSVDLIVRPKENADALFTVSAIRLVLPAIAELERVRVESEHRATLWPFEDHSVIGSAAVISGHMAEVMNFARRIARAKVNVLITGESGTGKEIIARAIHDFSDRAAKPFVPFNCTAVPRDLLESQLFGHRRGAFTGADRDHTGLIRAAREGTLFLDEIGELGLDLQPKLLRFLEAGEIAPLGEPGPSTVDVRIVAATNRSLEDAVREGRFREDLFYRLNVVRLSLKPLRERRDEIPGFVNQFVARAAADFGKGHLTVAEETMERLLLYRWPGNVRQLHNEIRRIVALAEPNATILPEAISDDILGALPIFRHPIVNGHELSISLQSKLLPTLARVECEMIRDALKQSGGRVNAAAKALGISRKGLYLKRQRLGI